MYRWWSRIVVVGIVLVVLLSLLGDVWASFWLLAAVLVTEGLAAYAVSKRLPTKGEREDARAYALGVGSVGVILVILLLC